MKRCKSDDEKCRAGYFVFVTFDPNHGSNSAKPRLEVFDKYANVVAKYDACVGYAKGCKTRGGDGKTPCGTFTIQSIDVKSGEESHLYKWNKRENVKGIYGKGKVFCRLTGGVTTGNGVGIHGWPKERYPYVYDSLGCVRIKEIHEFVKLYAYPTMKVVFNDSII